MLNSDLLEVSGPVYVKSVLVSTLLVKFMHNSINTG
jgi:hypothetical protein